MIKFEKSILIDKPQQEIFDYVSEPVNTSQWQEHVQSADWTSAEPNGIGSRQYNISRYLGRVFVSLPEITLWDSPNQHSSKANAPFFMETGMLFKPKGDCTKVTMRVEADPGSFFNITGEEFGKQMKMTFSSCLQSLKLIMEVH